MFLLYLENLAKPEFILKQSDIDFFRASACCQILMQSQKHFTSVRFVSFFFSHYTPSHDSCGVLWFHVGRPCVCPSVVRRSVVRPSVFCFRMITGVNVNGFSPNLVCALILWRSGLKLLMGKVRQISHGVLCPWHAHIFFPDHNLSKRQRMFTKLSMCIDIVEIGFGLQMGKFRQILTEFSVLDTPIFSFSGR